MKRKIFTILVVLFLSTVLFATDEDLAFTFYGELTPEVNNLPCIAEHKVVHPIILAGRWTKRE